MKNLLKNVIFITTGIVLCCQIVEKTKYLLPKNNPNKSIKHGNMFKCVQDNTIKDNMEDFFNKSLIT